MAIARRPGASAPHSDKKSVPQSAAQPKARALKPVAEVRQPPPAAAPPSALAAATAADAPADHAIPPLAPAPAVAAAAAKPKVKLKLSGKVLGAPQGQAGAVQGTAHAPLPFNAPGAVPSSSTGAAAGAGKLGMKLKFSLKGSAVSGVQRTLSSAPSLTASTATGPSALRKGVFPVHVLAHLPAGSLKPLL
jgi:hypothetical protein